MQLRTLLAALKEPPVAFYNATELSELSWINALAYDSRKVMPGGLFIAVPGSHTDGRRYLADVAQHGAVVALGPQIETSDPPLPYIEVEDVRRALANLACAFYGYPANQLCTIGVTGTDGKTTTCNLISTLLEVAGKQSSLMTTANFKMCGQEWENTTRQSTLEALEIQQFLRRVVDAARLFEMLDPARDKGLGIQPIAILNRDDGSYEVLKPYCKVPILDYGIDQAAAVRAVNVRLDAYSTRFRAILPGAEIDIETQLVGHFNVSNCLAAIATVYSMGVKAPDIAHGLAGVTGVSGRMERIDEGQPFTVIVDYAHTPDSLEKVLNMLRSLTAGKLMVVFGSAGERDIQKRPIMGQIAAQKSDFFVITDEDPREEDRGQILHAIARGAQSVGKYEGRDFLCIADRTQAIATAFAHARAGDTVLLAGKGHEQSIIVGREKIPWDDRRVAREQLRLLF